MLLAPGRRAVAAAWRRATIAAVGRQQQLQHSNNLGVLCRPVSTRASRPLAGPFASGLFVLHRQSLASGFAPRQRAAVACGLSGHLQQCFFFASSAQPDYYQVLDVQKSATLDEIKKAYLTKAKKLHPDLNPSPDAKAQFQRLGEAYTVLKDPAKRRAFDRGTYDARHDPDSSYGSAYGGVHASGEDVFWEVWNELGLQDYLSTLQNDTRIAFTDALEHGNWDTLWTLAKNRKGLIFGIVMPLAATLRFPALVAVALRGVFFLPALWMRFVPWPIQVALYAELWSRYVDWANLQGPSEGRSSTSNKKTSGQQKRRRRGSRPWDK